MRQILHPLFQKVAEGISEFTFANLYLFRATHQYRVSMLAGELLLITGVDGIGSFFMLPFGLPDGQRLEQLFEKFKTMKCVSSSQAQVLRRLGYEIKEDRDNFDYLYTRQDLAELAGRNFHKKRNLIKAFLNNYSYEGRPLLQTHKEDVLEILEKWRLNRDEPGDYVAAKEALEKAEELQLCGGIYYVEGNPVAYSLGEELACGKSFVIHFEKAVSEYKGLWQFINQAFASILPEQYETVNREQDLGNEGLRKAKLSYRPIAFVEKFKATVPLQRGSVV
ncbi:MAG: DUF2156 domain-containing protein [Proteobacteria bacterium]|nr:DUF2156 domain-containing protein [Pseudomonadota bacterium]MBU1060184.1 DUF2156 domain-containing protein [Pseudomonadota bacterium]